jgi:hypothetical protein
MRPSYPLATAPRDVRLLNTVVRSKALGVVDGPLPQAVFHSTACGAPLTVGDFPRRSSDHRVVSLRASSVSAV